MPGGGAVAGTVEGPRDAEEDDGYEDVASAEAGARAEERARRHLDDYLGRAPIRAPAPQQPKPSRPPPAGVGTSKRARMLLSYTNGSVNSHPTMCGHGPGEVAPREGTDSPATANMLFCRARLTIARA